MSTVVPNAEHSATRALSPWLLLTASEWHAGGTQGARGHSDKKVGGPKGPPTCGVADGTRTRDTQDHNLVAKLADNAS